MTKLSVELALENSLKIAMDKSARNYDLLAICFLKIEGFKVINDRLDHQLEKDLLIAASSRVKRGLRVSDSIISFNSDELVLLLGGIKCINDLDLLLTRILKLFNFPFVMSGKSIPITANIGVSIYPTDTSSVYDLIGYANNAMYQSKDKGKNKWALFHT